MGKQTKQSKKFASSGKLKDTIKRRRQHQQVKRKVEDRDQRRAKQRGNNAEDFSGDEQEDSDDEEVKERKEDGGKPLKSVDELFATGDDEDGDLEDEDAGSDFADLSGEEEDELQSEEAMAEQMAALEKKDPEFFQFLKENDAGLLDFGADKGKGKADEDDAMDEDEEEEVAAGDEDDDEMEVEQQEMKKVSVTLHMLRGWQRGMLKQHSLRSLRKTVLAFRAAAHMNEEETDVETAYTIDSAIVFNKVVVTALKYTPVVLNHHLPVKYQQNGRIRLLPSTTPHPTLPRLILSHFSTLLHLIKSLPTTPSSIAKSEEEEAGGLLLMAVDESIKLLPWIMNARKHLRAYVKLLLDIWSVAVDKVRIACFLAIRKIFIAGDDAIKDLCLKSIYQALLPPFRLTTAHTLPSLNLMKNTASELYQLAPALSYQHGFAFIRMLAVHLRGVVRSTTTGGGNAGGNGEKDAFKAVYNWQFVHAIDFWSLVLSGACDRKAEIENGGLESPLKALIYPLVQISLGAIRLLPSSRYFPLRFHILHSLIRVISRTGTYVPLSPFLLEILDSAEFRRTKPKNSTLKPLDLEYSIRAPAAYPKTRTFQETLGDELVFILGEYHAAMSTNIAFPEIALPVVLSIRRHIKRQTAGSPKVQAQLKTLVEKLEATRTWVESKRRNVSFAPNDRAEVDRFLQDVEIDKSPVGSWMKIQKKVRDGKRREVEKALREEQEVEEESEGESESDDE